MLIDIIVKNHKIVAAKPINQILPPLILIKTDGGGLVISIKWTTRSNYNAPGLAARLRNRVFGRLKGDALAKAYEIVRDNGGLDISGEYGSIEIDDSEFEASEELNQKPAIAE